jgi:RNA polymerase sigma factor for flagellar operon FliA
MPTTGNPPAAPAFAEKERERLILENIKNVEMIARRIARRVGARVEFEDLVSAGVVGLISAIDNFDPEQDVKLKTYAEYKIKGAILDSLRALDNVPRGHRRRVKQIEQASLHLQHTLSRTPSHDEIAEALGLSAEKYEEARLAEAATVPLSLDEFLGPHENTTHVTQRVSSEPSPEVALADAELRDILVQLIATLPEIQQRLIRLHYSHGVPMVLLAKLLGLTRWEAYSARDAGLAALRERLAYFSKVGGTLPEEIEDCRVVMAPVPDGDYASNRRPDKTESVRISSNGPENPDTRRANSSRQTLTRSSSRRAALSAR